MFFFFLFFFFLNFLSSSHIFSISYTLPPSHCHFLFSLFFSLSYRSLSSHPSLQITVRRQWKHVYDELGGNPSSTSAATCTRRHYERWVIMLGCYMWHVIAMHAHTWNSLHRLKCANSPTAASNMISQCFIHNIRTLQDKYWSYSGGASALTRTCIIVFATAYHCYGMKF